MLNALSVDVEEYFHAEIFRNGTRGAGIRALESRVEASVDVLLSLLGTRTKGTFFTLGEIENMIRDGTIDSSGVLAALYLAKLHGLIKE